MHLTPLLLRPRVRSLINSYAHSSCREAGKRGLVLLLLLTALVMYCIYAVAVSVLTDIRANHFAVPLSVPITVLFATMTGMMFASSCVNSLGALFLAKDVDLVLSAPITWRQFVTARLLDVFLRSGWLLCLFGVPVLAALGIHFRTGFSGLVCVIVASIPVLVVPTAIAVTASTLIALMIPAKRLQDLSLLLTLVAGIALLFFLEARSGETSLKGPDLQTMLTFAGPSWLPFHSSAKVVSELLTGGRGSYEEWACIALWSLGSLLAAFTIVGKSFDRSLAKARLATTGLKLNSKRGQQLLVLMTPLMRPETRSLFAKEFKMFARDLTQAVQLLMLLAVCLLYLYNFRLLQRADGINESVRLWWQAILVVCNAGMASLISVAISTRFVFPSVSMEGTSWWLVQTAPITIERVLRAKFRIWLVPMIFAATIISAAGACAINAPFSLLIWSLCFTPVVTYGVTALAIGIGTIFCNFEWEYSAQAATSLGSLVYMAAAIALAGLSLLPFASVVLAWTLAESGVDVSRTQILTLSGLCLLLLVQVSRTAGRWALRAGAQELRRRSHPEAVRPPLT